jgi:amidophosphoribosyltransferase
VIGKLDNSYVAVSETCALDLIDAEFVREVEPGEIVTLSNEGMESEFPLERKKTSKFCAFEPIYFARPDSRIFGEEIYSLRKEMGKALAKEAPVECDTVIAVPDSGVPIAQGFGDALGIPVELGLVRNHYVGRTFIQPSQEIRDFNVKLKLNPVKSVLEGKRVAVIDDSIVRGTTAVKIIRMLRKAGAKEVHLRVGAPPITHSCFYGVDTPKRKRLLAAQKNVQEICELLGADSIGYLSVDGLKEVLNKRKNGDDSYCVACFTGKYPEPTFKDIEEQPTDSKGTGLVWQRT